MAINTAAKRISGLNHLSGQRIILPDGTIAANDRQAIAPTYSGILATTPTIGGGMHNSNDIVRLFKKDD